MTKNQNSNTWKSSLKVRKTSF